MVRVRIRHHRPAPHIPTNQKRAGCPGTANTTRPTISAPGCRARPLRSRAPRMGHPARRPARPLGSPCSIGPAFSRRPLHSGTPAAKSQTARPSFNPRLKGQNHVHASPHPERKTLGRLRRRQPLPIPGAAAPPRACLASHVRRSLDQLAPGTALRAQPAPAMLTTTAHYSAWSREIAADIAKARASITLTAISCLPPRGKSLTDFGRLWAALAASAAAGCRLRFILPAPQRAHAATLRNGAAAEAIRDIGGECTLITGSRLLHAKTVLVDDAIGWCGSGNWTAAAAHYNHECWIRTTDPAAVATLRTFQDQIK